MEPFSVSQWHFNANLRYRTNPFAFIAVPESIAEVPRESLKYKRELIRHSRIIWGLDAPIPLFASQIHQESTWNHLAKSKYAKGLTQFTDSTAEWMIEIFPELKEQMSLILSGR